MKNFLKLTAILCVICMALVLITGCFGCDDANIDADEYYANDYDASIEDDENEEVETERINLAELYNWNTREFEDIRHLLGRLIDVESVTDYEILGGGGVTFRSYRFESGNSVVFWFGDEIQSFYIDYDEADDRTRVHFNGIDGTSRRNDVIAALGEPYFTWDGGERLQYFYEFYAPGYEGTLPAWSVSFTFDDNLMVTAIYVGLHIN
ncbi:MAG: hypothetical protein FWE04_08190 [Oscillospiraceae bacterium]|nr:hypothetical protein [Oscillospiraceae bacterium]